MSDQIPKPSSTTNDEIDLGQMFGIINKGIQRLFKAFLRLFVYVRSNIFILGILAIVGLAMGYGLNKIMKVKTMTEVILSPNLDSKNYLYKTVQEINGKIKARDTAFFAALDIDLKEIEKFEMQVEDLVNISTKEKEDDIQLLEQLQKFENSAAIDELIGNILADHSSQDLRMTFFYKDIETGPGVAQKILDHINNNRYYRELVGVFNENAASRIRQNEGILKQLDTLIQNYSEGMNSEMPDGQLILSEDEDLNIADLFTLKNVLIAQTEAKRIELQKRKTPFSIIDFGGSQPVRTPLFGKAIFLVPLLLLGLFVLKDVVKYLSRKSSELL